MAIKKLIIKNFKCFKENFEIDFNEGVNIIVGNNGIGKTTILEAINLALTGNFRGRNIKNELSQNLFNKDVVNEYIEEINKSNKAIDLPEIIIEIYFELENEEFSGDYNLKNSLTDKGIRFEIKFDENYSSEYKLLVKEGIKSLPIEYYKINLFAFSREKITTRSIPFKSALIDNSSPSSINKSDSQVSRIVKNFLEDSELLNISQEYRNMKENFSESNSIKTINNKIKNEFKEDLKLAVDFGTKNQWETTLVTNLNGVTFGNLGKGMQSIIKTELSLYNTKDTKKEILLFEEPECHLSHSNLNKLLNLIESYNDNKQIIITTHNSFVANKLGLENLILMNSQNVLKLSDLSNETFNYFKKISGYDTLRIILASKVILVEGPSDELIVQRAYMDKNNKKLPIQDGIDVISVGTAFLRFLDIADRLNLKVNVITDNDGDLEMINNKYQKYLNRSNSNIKICFDNTDNLIKTNIKDYNSNTLEPLLFRENKLEVIKNVLKINYNSDDEVLKYMKNNKTEVALKIFESNENIEYPNYILEGIKFD